MLQDRAKAAPALVVTAWCFTERFSGRVARFANGRHPLVVNLFGLLCQRAHEIPSVGTNHMPTGCPSRFADSLPVAPYRALVARALGLGKLSRRLRDVIASGRPGAQLFKVEVPVTP